MFDAGLQPPLFGTTAGRKEDWEEINTWGSMLRWSDKILLLLCKLRPTQNFVMPVQCDTIAVFPCSSEIVSWEILRTGS